MASSDAIGAEEMAIDGGVAADRIRSALSNKLSGHILYDAAVLEARSAYRNADKP